MPVLVEGAALERRSENALASRGSEASKGLVFRAIRRGTPASRRFLLAVFALTVP
jgi:hypothetical protein